MNKQMTGSVFIALFLLAGCASSGPKFANSIEDIVGTWQSNTSSAEVQINEDGTVRAQFPDARHHVGEFWFEGTRLFFIDPSKTLCALEGYETGIYEVELLENGNRKFIVIEDECMTRVNYFVGRLVGVEWEPVP